jgi:hypothetical protein
MVSKSRILSLEIPSFLSFDNLILNRKRAFSCGDKDNIGELECDNGTVVFFGGRKSLISNVSRPIRIQIISEWILIYVS